MTYVQALNIALETMTDTTAIERVNALIASLQNHHKSDEAKAKANEKRKAATASARAALVDKIAPILREGLSHTQQGVTVKELYSLVEDKLPDGFTPAQVQNILIREMAPELDKIERKGKSNLYRLAKADDPNQYLPDEVAV